MKRAATFGLGAIQPNTDDYWTDEEREAWDRVLRDGLNAHPTPPLRRSTRPVRRGRLAPPNLARPVEPDR